MSPSASAFRLGAGVLGILLLAVYLRPERASLAVQDAPPSTLSTEPAGAQAFAEALAALGVPVERMREPLQHLRARADSGQGVLLAALAPGTLSPAEQQVLWDWVERSDLLLAGAGVETLAPCVGYTVERVSGTDGAAPWERRVGGAAVLMPRMRTRRPQGPDQPGAARVARRFVPSAAQVHVDSSRQMDSQRFTCDVPVARQVDTLLVTRNGHPVVLRVTIARTGRTVLLIADEELLRNRSLRYAETGPLLLGLVLGRYDRVLFDEYHHGHGAKGSLLGLLLRWGRETPWGWSLWHLGLVGLLVLLLGAVRFGPIRTVRRPARRSPLEHVRALATALAAAQGHDEAVAAIVRGLRRRLAPTEHHHEDWPTWLRRIRTHAGSARAQLLIDDLLALASPGQPLASVQRAALTVEDLWLELRP